jgi:hypothetical protein
MNLHGYRLIEYDALRPWIVLSQQHRTVELPEGVDFDRWARRRFPDDRFRVLPDEPPGRWPPVTGK